jgi:hypothetical protein
MNRCSLGFGSKGHHFNTPYLALIAVLTLFSCQRTKNKPIRSRTLYNRISNTVKGRSELRENQIEDCRER